MKGEMKLTVGTGLIVFGFLFLALNTSALAVEDEIVEQL